MRAVNRTRDVVLAEQAERADSMLSRMKGLLGRKDFSSGEGLWIVPCNQIHTWFMRFPIDAVFIDKRGTVLRIYRQLAPWRFTRIVWKARAVLELPAGSVGDTVNEGDELALEPSP